MADAGSAQSDEHLTGAGPIELELLDRHRLSSRIGAGGPHVAKHRTSDLHSAEGPSAS